MAQEFKTPEKLRLVFREEREWNDGDTITSILGFATAHEPDTKAYDKRVNTQNNWAYGYYHRIEADGIHMYGRRRKDGNINEIEEFDERVSDNLQPKVIDNVPISGFQIQHSVTRWSTSNKVWRILDPRGFELEIQTANMEDIIMSGQTDRGLIDGKLIWQTVRGRIYLARAD
jgi:hypothetical protein